MRALDKEQREMIVAAALNNARVKRVNTVFPVSQMFLHLQPNLLKQSTGLYPSPGHRTTRVHSKTRFMACNKALQAYFLGLLFHNSFTIDGVLREDQN